MGLQAKLSCEGVGEEYSQSKTLVDAVLTLNFGLGALGERWICRCRFLFFALQP